MLSEYSTSFFKFNDSFNFSSFSFFSMKGSYLRCSWRSETEKLIGDSPLELVERVGLCVFLAVGASVERSPAVPSLPLTLPTACHSASSFSATALAAGKYFSGNRD